MDKIALGLDISKLTIDACFHGPGDFMKVENTPSGIERLIERINHYQQNGREIHVCCEYTGNYYLQAAYTLYQAGIKISVINPLAIKAYAEYKLRCRNQ
ncbi:IS110 family transposase [Eikenella glucosivorans]|nr:transposase [Eikenella glucosivorans]